MLQVGSAFAAQATENQASLPQTAEQFYQAYEQKSHIASASQQAFQDLKQAAQLGNTEAMCHLAEVYQDGRYGIYDNAQAIELLKAAAQKGSVRAKTDLGITYFKGIGIPQNDQQAQYWLEQGSIAGDLKAPRYLGMLYQKRSGQHNQKKAFESYQLAANRGDITSQYLLATMYEQGLGTAKDLKLALH